MLTRKRIWPHQAIYWSTCISIVVLAPALHCKKYICFFCDILMYSLWFFRLVMQRFMKVKINTNVSKMIHLHLLRNKKDPYIENNALAAISGTCIMLQLYCIINMPKNYKYAPAIFVSILIYKIHTA